MIGPPTSSVTTRGSAVKDQYVVHITSGVAAATCSELSQSASHAANMADAVEMSDTADQAQSGAIAPILPKDQYSGLVQAVAALISPTRQGYSFGYHTSQEIDLEDAIQSSHTSEQHSRHIPQ